MKTPIIGESLEKTMSINLKVPDMKELKPRITVFGVGGAGGNAVNNMITAGLEGVEFVVANTDAQALAMSSAERRIQMGTAITEGLGAGSKPEIGAAAADEAIEEIKSQLTGSHMAFITAGMGGGTGTGAAPVIAKTSFEQKILTVGVVTKPFHFEGQRRMDTADAGIKELAKYVDTLIIIPNQNLFRVATEKTTFADAFALADEVLHSGVACITDLMVKEGLINLDFADVKAVMAGMGKAMMGTGEASGDKRAIEAAEAAISNPLLDDVSMSGASGLLISITGGDDLTLYEVDEAASRIREEVDPAANIILGATFDKSLDGQIRVSVVATGLEKSNIKEVVSNEKQSVETLTKRIAELKPSESQAPALAAAPRAPQQAAPVRAAKPLMKQSQPAQPAGSRKAPAEVKIEKRAPQAQASPPVAPKGARQGNAGAAKATFVPQPPAQAKAAPRRMPVVADFPDVVQKELAAKSTQAKKEEVGIHAQKKKVGFFERLTGIGRKQKVEAVSRAREPVLDSKATTVPAKRPQPVVSPAPQAQKMPQAQQVPNVKSAPVQGPHGPASATSPKISKARLARGGATPKTAGNTASVQQDEEDLEIPAFLRRQAN